MRRAKKQELITFIRPYIEELQANNIYIESFIKLQKENPSLNVSFRHLTTSNIGKEQKPEHRIGDLSVLSLWRNLAKAGDLSDLCRIVGKLKQNLERFGICWISGIAGMGKTLAARVLALGILR